VVASFGPAAASHAVPITYGWTATVTAVESTNGALSEEFAVGDRVDAVLTIDATDSQSDPSRGSYESSEPWEMFIDGYRVRVDTTELGIGNGSAEDALELGSNHLFGGLVGGQAALFPEVVMLRLVDEQGAAFTNDELPTASLDLALFETRTFVVHFASTTSLSGSVGGVVTSFTVVPETSALGGLALAALVIAAGSKRRARQ
jgi:hypothetical protein